MADNGETAENRGVKLLKQHPVTDHMLDVVTHLRHHRDEKVSAIILMVKCRERDSFGGLDRVLSLQICCLLLAQPNSPASRLGIANANNTMVTAKNAMALIASDQ